MRFHRSSNRRTTEIISSGTNSDNENLSSTQSAPPISSLSSSTLTDSDRLFYRKHPSKCQSVSDWLIVLSQAKNRNEIQLSDLNRGIKFVFCIYLLYLSFF